MRKVTVLVILVFSVKMYGCLLKNCVTEEEWIKDETGTPRCEIFSKNRIHVQCPSKLEVSVIRQSPRNQHFDNTPFIHCNASYPIDILQSGFKYKGQPKIFFFRKYENRQKLFSIVIPLFSNIWGPRWFVFHSIERPKIYTKFYLYYAGGNDRSLPFDWPNQKIFPNIVEPETKYATLPCTVTHRSDLILLKKNKCSTGEDLEIEQDNSTVRFDPKIGFIVDTYALEQQNSVWGIYTCEARNPRKSKTDIETLQVTLRKPREFSFEPSQSYLYYFDGSNLELSCKSSQALKMDGTFNGNRIPYSNFSIVENRNWRSNFNGRYSRILKVGDYGQVTCETESIEQRHTWTFVTLDLMDNVHLKFINNGTSVRCSSRVSSYVTIFNAECYNLAHCRSREEAIEDFGSGQCDLKLSKIVQCGYHCERHSNDKCLDIRSTRRSGVFKCETDDLAHRIMYLIGYDGQIYTDVANLEKIPAEALIRIGRPSKAIYINSHYKFACQASSFISNGEFHWIIRGEDGTSIRANITDTREFHDFKTGNDSIYEADIYFHEPMSNIEIVCLVPIWNTKYDWINHSIKLDILQPTIPVIEGKDSYVFYIGDNHQLPCKVEGQPIPTIKWFHDGNEIDTNDGKTLYFGEITESTEGGIYTCSATNPGGTVSKDFEVSIQTKPNIGLYIAIGIVFLVLLCGALLFLYWKLIKAKRKIRNLTDEEVHEFLHGNAEAVKTAKDQHQVIMYMPFSPDFEISKDRLHFDEYNVLGSGAYGIVFKGKLSGYPNDVAIKTLKPHSTLSYFKALLSELKIMAYLGQHENVVELIGAYTGQIKERVVYMVVELSPFGSLEEFLRDQSRTFQNQIINDQIVVPKGSSTPFYANFVPNSVENTLYVSGICTSDLVSMSHQIAEGMYHLASKKVIHADLAVRNVLLYANGIVKITDFGLSRQLYAYTNYMKKNQEPLPWRSMALESLREMKFSQWSDVWSYGVTLWEIFTLGSVPYPGLDWSQDFVENLSQGLRLSKPTLATSSIYEIMLRCWHNIEEERPSFDELRTIFSQLRHSLEKF